MLDLLEILAWRLDRYVQKVIITLYKVYWILNDAKEDFISSNGIIDQIFGHIDKRGEL